MHKLIKYSFKIFLVTIIISILIFSGANFVYAWRTQATATNIKITPSSNSKPQQAQNYYHAGYKAYYEEDYETAIKSFAQALELSPENWSYLQWRGYSYTKNKLYDKAIKDLKLALRKAPASQHNNIYNWLAKAYTGQGNLDQALKNQNLCIKHNGDAYDYFNRAEIYALNAMPAEAIDDYTTSLLNTNQGYAQMYLGGVFWQATCYQKRGSLYLERGQVDKAKDDAKKALEISPRLQKAFNDENILDLFDSKKRQMMVEQALSIAQRAESDRNFLDALKYLEKAQAWCPIIKEEQNKEIIESILRVYPKLSLKPALSESSRRFYVQAQTLTRAKDYNGAINAYEKLLGLTPWHPEAYFNKAMLEGENKKYEQAIQDMKKYLQLSPDASDCRAAQDKIYEWEVFMNR